MLCHDNAPPRHPPARCAGNCTRATCRCPSWSWTRRRQLRNATCGARYPARASRRAIRTVPVALLYLLLVASAALFQLVSMARSSAPWSDPEAPRAEGRNPARHASWACTPAGGSAFRRACFVVSSWPGRRRGYNVSSASAADPVGGAEARLYVLVAGLQGVIPGVVATQVHRARWATTAIPAGRRRPGGVRQARPGAPCPEVLHRHRQPAVSPWKAS